MSKAKNPDKVKLLVSMPRRLHKRLGLALVRAGRWNRSEFICEVVEKALDSDLHYREVGENGN